MENLKTIDEPAPICNNEVSTSFQANNESLIFETMFCNDPENSSKHSEELFKIEGDGKREPYIKGKGMKNADRKKDKCTRTVLNEEQDVIKEQENVRNEGCALRGEEYVDEEGFWFMDMGGDVKEDNLIKDTQEVTNKISQFENKVNGKGEEVIDNETEVERNPQSDLMEDGEYEQVDNDGEEVKVATKDARQNRPLYKTDDYQKLRKCVVVVENIKELKKFKKRMLDLNEGSDKDGMTTVKHSELTNEQRIATEKLLSTTVNDEVVGFDDLLKDISVEQINMTKQPGKSHTNWTGCSLPTMEETLPSDYVQELDKMVENTETVENNGSMKTNPTVSLHISSSITEENEARNVIIRQPMKKKVYEHKVAGFKRKAVNREARKPVKLKKHSDTLAIQKNVENKSERNVIRNEDQSERRKYTLENYHPHDKNDDRQYSFGKFERSCFVRVSRLPCSMYCTLRHCSVNLYPLPRYLIPTKNNCLRLPQEMVTEVRKKTSKKSKKSVIKTKKMGQVYERNPTSKAHYTLKNASFWKDGFFLFKRSSRKSTSPYKISSKRERFCRQCLHCG